MSNTLDDHDRDQESYDSREPIESSPQQPSGCRNFALGCGCAAGGLLLVVAGLGIWLALNWKNWAADLGK